MSWVKIHTDLLTDVKLKRIARKVPCAKWIWVALLLICKDGGLGNKIGINEEVPYEFEELADIIGVSKDEIQRFISEARKLGMVCIDDKGFITIVNWEKRQYSPGYLKVKRYRERRKKSSSISFAGNPKDNHSDYLHDNLSDDPESHQFDNRMITQDADTESETDTDTEDNYPSLTSFEKDSCGQSPPPASPPETLSTCEPQAGEEETPSLGTTKRKNSTKGNGSPPCPHQEIIDLYHEILPELPRVRVWNGTRRKLLQARWRENPEHQSLDFWRSYFNTVRQSDFLLGRIPGSNGNFFQATLEWLIRPTNFAKVLEGFYSNRPVVSRTMAHNLRVLAQIERETGGGPGDDRHPFDLIFEKDRGEGK